MDTFAYNRHEYTQKETTHIVIWVPKDTTSKAQSSQAINIQESKCLKNPLQVTGDTYSSKYKWVPKAPKQGNLNDLARVPKEVQLPQTSMSTKQGNYAPQPSHIQSSDKWVWKPKQIEKKKNPQPQVNPIKMIWQQKTQVQVSKVKPLLLPTSPTSPINQGKNTMKL